MQAELLQSHDKTLTEEELVFTGGQKKWFLEMEATPGGDAVSIVEMTKDLEYSINLVDKAAAVLEMTDSSFEGSSTVGKMLSNGIACYKQIIHEKKSQLMWEASLLPCFKKLPQIPPPSAKTSTEQPSTMRQDQQKDYKLLKTQMIVSIFQH